MATPTVAGALALILEDYRAQFGGPDPSNALIKTFLIQNALDLGNPGPDYQFGYGAIRVQDTIDFVRTGQFLEESVDQGGRGRFSISVGGADPELRLSLAWDDAPGTPNVFGSLVNDLDLVVTDPLGTRHYPFTLDPQNPGVTAIQTASDHLNNVEQVIVTSPMAGNWSVEVVGTNVPEGPQSYGISASHPLQEGPYIQIQLLDLVPEVLSPGVPETLVAEVFGVNESLVGTPELHLRYDGGAFLVLPMSPLGGDLWEVTLPAAVCGATPEFYFSADGSLSGTNTNPPQAPTNVYQAVVAGTTILFADDFETNQGWVIQNTALTDGGWERGTPAGLGDRSDPIVDYDGSGQCYLTDNVAGNSDVDGGPTDLISPILDLSGTDPVLEYARWFANNSFDIDRFDAEVSNNGGSTWTSLESIGGDTSGWSTASFRLADFIAVTNQMQFRFRVTDNPNDSVTEAALDAITVFETDCSVTLDDCNSNFVEDASEIAVGLALDSNTNGIPDGCESNDCDNDGIPDDQEPDCDNDGVPDDCEGEPDCNSNGIPDSCDISSGASNDVNSNGIPDECDPDCDNDGIPDDVEADCDNDGVPDDCEGEPDCNLNGIPDSCDISSGASNDVNSNGIPDECDPDCDNDGIPDDVEADCDNDGVPDDCEGEPDCNSNGIPDSCDISSGASNDVNSNGIPDECDPDCDNDGIPDDVEADCDNDGIPDDCEGEPDCNSNGIPDSCDISSGASNDVNSNGIPDECDPDCDNDGIPDDVEADCDNDGVPDDCEGEPDCNSNGIPDSCDISSGASNDVNSNGIPDECDPDCDNDGIPDDVEADCDNDGVPDECEGEPDCNSNGIPDSCDISSGASNDVNSNGIPDECEPDCDNDGIPDDVEADCDNDGVPDDCEGEPDCNSNGIPDSCDISSGASNDVNSNGIPDECDPDCDNDGIPDDVEADCDNDGVPDDCEGEPDCNLNGIPDSCDISSGASNDVNSNGIPDECDPDCDNDGIPDDVEADCDNDGVPDDCEGEPDCNLNGIPDSCDISSGASNDVNSNGIPDECDPDCDNDGIPDDVEADCDNDGIPDDCEADCDADGIPDDCENDCDGDGIPDDCEPDCDNDGVPDDCEHDCDNDNIPDDCENDLTINYGLGTAGTGGVVPEISSTGGAPSIGTDDFTILGSSMLPNATCFYYLGISPLDAQVSGATLLVNPVGALRLRLVTDGSGNLEVGPFILDPNPDLIGVTLYNQILVLDSGAAGGISATNGLEMTICDGL